MKFHAKHRVSGSWSGMPEQRCPEYPDIYPEYPGNCSQPQDSLGPQEVRWSGRRSGGGQVVRGSGRRSGGLEVRQKSGGLEVWRSGRSLVVRRSRGPARGPVGGQGVRRSGYRNPKYPDIYSEYPGICVTDRVRRNFF
jgi:hypothetical protein